jgi:hypothetical protein
MCYQASAGCAMRPCITRSTASIAVLSEPTRPGASDVPDCKARSKRRPSVARRSNPNIPAQLARVPALPYRHHGGNRLYRGAQNLPAGSGYMTREQRFNRAKPNRPPGRYRDACAATAPDVTERAPSIFPTRRFVAWSVRSGACGTVAGQGVGASSRPSPAGRSASTCATSPALTVFSDTSANFLATLDATKTRWCTTLHGGGAVSRPHGVRRECGQRDHCQAYE